MEKRGVSSQVFIYIFIIIVVGLVFLFGFQQINKLIELNEKTIYVEFQTEFKKAVEEIYNKNAGSKVTYSVGSSNKPLRLPKSIGGVFFEDEGGRARVIPDDENYNSFTVDNLRTSEGYIETNGQMSFVLENVIEEGETRVVLEDVQ